MKYEKEVKTRTVHAIGFVSALLLLIAIAFVGGAGATSFSVGSNSSLVNAINGLDSDDVDIGLTADIILTSADVKNISTKLGYIFINYGVNADRKLAVSFNGHTINAKKDGKTVILGGTTGHALLSISKPTANADVKASTVATIDNISGSFTYNTETLKLEGITGVTVTLNQTGNGNAYLTVSSNANPVGEISAMGESFTITKVSVVNQPLKIKADGNQKTVTIEPMVDNDDKNMSMTGYGTITEGMFNVTINDFSFIGNYNDGIKADGMIGSGKVVYKPTGGENVAAIAVSDMIGNYGSQTSLSGNATLLDDNLKLTRHIPVPSFVSGVFNLNGHSVKICSDGKIMTTNSPGNGKVMLTGVGTFDNAVTDNAKFSVDEDNNFMWSTDHKSIVKDTDDEPIYVKNITSNDLPSKWSLVMTNPTEEVSKGTTYGNYKVTSPLTSFELYVVDGTGKKVSYSGSVTATFELNKAIDASNTRVFHKVGTSWESYAVTHVSGNTYSFTTPSLSPFTVAEATYVGGGSSSGGSGGSYIEKTITPYPTATPTPTATSAPGVIPTSVHTQSTTSKSPAPIFGILAGLGAAAVAGLVLRRK